MQESFSEHSSALLAVKLKCRDLDFAHHSESAWEISYQGFVHHEVATAQIKRLTALVPIVCFLAERWALISIPPCEKTKSVLYLLAFLLEPPVKHGTYLQSSTTVY